MRESESDHEEGLCWLLDQVDCRMARAEKRLVIFALSLLEVSSHVSVEKLERKSPDHMLYPTQKESR